VLLEVRAIGKRFDASLPRLQRWLSGAPRAVVRAVEALSLVVHSGETLALVGESGCGKSTVARMLVGLMPPDEGEIRFGGLNLPATLAAGGPSARALRRRLQMVFQDPYSSLNPRWPVGKTIAEPLLVHGLVDSPRRAIPVVEALLQDVGLGAADLGKYPHQFSGGQRQRLAIARALGSEPDFLVCDEPTSALDVSVQAQVLNLLSDLQRQRGLSIVFISHNLAVVRHVADRVGVMYLGRMVEMAETDELFARPRHPYTRSLLDAVPDMSFSGRPRSLPSGELPNPLDVPTGCAFHPRCPLARERCRQELPVLRPAGAAASVACHAVEEGRA
jgi:peptide/nickel transport system ATP-binding protein